MGRPLTTCISTLPVPIKPLHFSPASWPTCELSCLYQRYQHEQEVALIWKGYTFHADQCHFQSQRCMLPTWNSLSGELHDLLKSLLHISSSELVPQGPPMHPAIVTSLLLIRSELWSLNTPVACSFHSMFLAIKSNWYVGTSRLNHMGHFVRGSRKTLISFKLKSRKVMRFSFASCFCNWDRT